MCIHNINQKIRDPLLYSPIQFWPMDNQLVLAHALTVTVHLIFWPILVVSMVYQIILPAIAPLHE